MREYKSFANHRKTSTGLKISAIGDSLTTGFYVTRYLPTVWRARTKFLSNWFEASALVDESSARSFIVGKALSVEHFSSQVDGLLSLERFPDIALVWIGHNNLDWAQSCNG